MLDKEFLERCDKAIEYMKMEYPSFHIYKNRKEIAKRIQSRILDYPNDMSVVELVNTMSYILKTWN